MTAVYYRMSNQSINFPAAGLPPAQNRAVTPRGRPVLYVAALVSAAGAISGASQTPSARPADRQQFLEMFARSYFPGRSGQLFVIPREGEVITRADPDYAYMHGSPWSYDVAIPLMFAGPAVTSGVMTTPAVQQDVAPTMA